MSDSVTAGSSTQTLQKLEESRHFLLQLVRVAGLIEGLKRSLEHMLAEGLDGTDVEPGMARLIERLGRKVQKISDADVVLSLEKRDRRLRGLFVKLTPLIEQVQSGEDLSEALSLGSAADDVGALKRLAKTALALRGVLNKRGVAVPEFRLPLDRSSLREQLYAIARQEQAARRAVIQQVRVLGSDIQQLLKQAGLPETMRHLLKQMLAGLRENLAHLKAGQSVSELPLAIEDVSFLDIPPPSTRSGESEPAVGEDTTQESPPETSPPEDTLGEPPNLFRAIWLWIGSPWQVTWRDIRSGRYRG